MMSGSSMKCAVCGCEFIPPLRKDGRGGHRMYCSNRCKQRAYIWKHTSKVYAVVGDSCLVCGSKHRLKMHRKSGLNHEFVLNTVRGCEFVLSHAEEFVPLCQDCHGLVHHFPSNVNIELLLYLVSCLKIVGCRE